MCDQHDVLVPRHEVALACRHKTGYGKAQILCLDQPQRAPACAAYALRWLALATTPTHLCTGSLQLLCCRPLQHPCCAAGRACRTPVQPTAGQHASLSDGAFPCCAPVVPPTMTPSTPLATCKSSSLSYARKSNLPLGRYLQGQHIGAKSSGNAACVCRRSRRKFCIHSSVAAVLTQPY